MNHEYRFGIEEEFFLADAVTRGTPDGNVQAFHDDAQSVASSAERELLQFQVEIGSTPTASVASARAELAQLRRRLAEIGRANGLLVLAAGTHPIARWEHQLTTPKQRYEQLSEQMRMLASRYAACGVHVHVEVPRPDDRVGLMRRMMPFLPPLLALSTSSPFWQGHVTGLSAYRPSVMAEWPRMGLPDLFETKAEFDRYTSVMTACGGIKDASHLWWALRPSMKFSTLELRVSDSCTRLDDAIAIASVFRCLTRRLVREPKLNATVNGVTRALVAENLWRAQRDSVRAEFIDEASGAAVPFSTHLNALIKGIAEDAEALGCLDEVERARWIAAEGTSADRQLALFDSVSETANTDTALASVVDWIASTTLGS